MTCTYDREQLALYVNLDATSDERAATEEHLRMCAACRSIAAQYQFAAARLAVALTDVMPVQTSMPLRVSVPRPAPGRWRAVASAAAMVLALGAVMQVPAVAAQVARVFPFLEVFELDKSGVANFIRGFSQDTVGKVYNPDVYQSLAEAEQAWGGKIPQPTALPDGMERFRIEMFRWDSGHKDVYLRYRNTQSGGNLTVHLSTQPQQPKVPNGATSETMVDGQKAVVINGTWSQYAGKPLQWEADSDIHLFFPVSDLYGEVSTAGRQQGIAVNELLRVAESIR